MAKRGRKPSKKRKGYFYEEQEQAVKDYIRADSEEEKNKIFNSILLPAFTKMIESIIRRYNLYSLEEEQEYKRDEAFRQTSADTISFLMTKIENFDPESGYKAYSYCGTICKNYLIYKINQYLKKQKRNERYDTIKTDIVDNVKFSYNDSVTHISFLTELINDTIANIREMIDDKEKYKLNENEIKVGKALIALMSNWEELFAQMGSNKFNKSSILMFLKEMTLLNTKEIRDGMKKFKVNYYDIKRKLMENYL